MVAVADIFRKCKFDELLVELVYGIHIVLCRFEGCQNADVIDAAWAFVRKISDFS